MFFVFLVVGSLLGWCNVKLIAYFSMNEPVNKKLVFAITALSSLGSFLAFKETLPVVFHMVVWGILIGIALIDYYTKTIIDIMVYTIGGYVLMWRFISVLPLLDGLYGGLFGLIFYGLIYFLAKLYYKKEVFGFGDVMLMGVIGLYLGLSFTILASFTAFYLALFSVIVRFIRDGKKALKQVVAFGPYICMAAVIISVFGQIILNWYFRS